MLNLILYAPLPQNGQTHPNNLSAFALLEQILITELGTDCENFLWLFDFTVVY